MEICKHCNQNVAIRNPSGYCDHLYYPDNCETCKHLRGKEQCDNNCMRVATVLFELSDGGYMMLCKTCLIEYK